MAGIGIFKPRPKDQTPPVSEAEKLPKPSRLIDRVHKEAIAVGLVAAACFALSLSFAPFLAGYSAAILAAGAGLSCSEKGKALLGRFVAFNKDHKFALPLLLITFKIALIAAIILTFYAPLWILPLGLLCGSIYALTSDYLKTYLAKDYHT